MEGLDGKAVLLNNGEIKISTLEAYVAERVKKLTNREQTPTVAKPQCSILLSQKTNSPANLGGGATSGAITK